jgi:serine/threonine-protein kinase
VHRDIKPANLLVAPHGNVKITDFGVAHAAGSAPITLGGRVVGTPAYLAPERLAGARATPAADLYALGVVAYECLAGAPPFTGMPMEVAAAHRELPLPPLPATVPAEVATLVGELTAKDPAARPGSAAEVSSRAAHLRDAMGGGALSPCPRRGTVTQTLPELQAPGSNRRFAARSAALAVAAVLAAALLGLLVGGVFAGIPAAPRPSASPRMVEVGGSLAGQQVGAVSRQLRQLGMVVRVRWRPSGEQAPGTVLSVLPNGRVRAGSLVVVTGALQVPGNGHDHANNHGGDTGPGNGDGG